MKYQDIADRIYQMIKKLYIANRTILNESVSFLRTDVFPNVDHQPFLLGIAAAVSPFFTLAFYSAN